MFTSSPLLIAGTLFPAGLENRSEQKSFKAGVRYGLETPQTPQTATDSALNWELLVKPCFLLFQSCVCWLPAHCHSSVCSTELWQHQNISNSQLVARLGNTPVTLLRITLWLAGLALPQLSALSQVDTLWQDFMKTARINWQKQRCIGYVVNLLPSRPPSFSPSEPDFPDKESHSQSKKGDRRCQCRFLSCPNHRHRWTCSKHACTAQGFDHVQQKKSFSRAIGMENIAFTCVRQVYILRRRPTRVDKTPQPRDRQLSNVAAVPIATGVD